MIGRREEISVLDDCLKSGRPEFLALYGRRRVGKTYLIKEYFHDRFAFYATGVSNVNTKQQLRVFKEALVVYGDTVKTNPQDWFEAFSRLKALLSSDGVAREYPSGKRVVFLDELPWMDTARSDFKSALDYFWNSWASSQKDILLIVCGSATSWMIHHIAKDTGGFYNRLTRQIHLQPFCLEECEELLRFNKVNFSRRQILESYMVMGGIPYYLNYLRPQLSLAQNIEALFFQENGSLRYEFRQLFSSLFKRSDHYISIITELSRKSSGLTRTELINRGKTVQGKELTKCLEELEQCGFIRRYYDYSRKKNGCIFQLIDPMTLFCLTFLEDGKVASWLDFIDTPGYYFWCGLAFELVCLLHTKQIKQALGIAGVTSQEFSWRSKKTTPGAQIDLLIDRRDDVINICEMKYVQDEFAIDAAYEKELIHKKNVLREETGTKKALWITMMTPVGVKDNPYRGIVVNEIKGEDLFRH